MVYEPQFIWSFADCNFFLRSCVLTCSIWNKRIYYTIIKILNIQVQLTVIFLECVSSNFLNYTIEHILLSTACNRRPESGSDDWWGKISSGPTVIRHRFIAWYRRESRGIQRYSFVGSKVKQILIIHELDLSKMSLRNFNTIILRGYCYIFFFFSNFKNARPYSYNFQRSIRIRIK